MEFPLHCEVTLNSSLETVENCLKGGEDPNSRDDYGSTALHCVNYYDEQDDGSAGTIFKTTEKSYRSLYSFSKK